VFAVYEGFEGLVRGDVREVDWMTVNGWSSIGGSLLGTSRAAPKVPPPNNNNNNNNKCLDS
jgi:6-phosphofructokinase 1